MNDVDLETAKSQSLDVRVPFMEICGIIEVTLKIIFYFKGRLGPVFFSQSGYLASYIWWYRLLGYVL